ncbi:hypothetical protein CROQUDRAFT_660503 [Cronartium quercuum f. sp. fusiforme G11]|uniref:Chromo domain-containing protein n=1 Tax=Cronartium quercuum f. sp. fusiforme G11 TaxID=708437 RepID=A0A9P6NC62_9BASI|nr:hypothetical protein CROQUDRAFT_660503 [Cronartium quercuum f. sp. fusiforme G11]
MPDYDHESTPSSSSSEDGDTTDESEGRENSDQEYPVEFIADTRLLPQPDEKDSVREFKIKFKGYDLEDRWYDEGALEGSPKLVEVFWKHYQFAKNPDTWIAPQVEATQRWEKEDDTEEEVVVEEKDQTDPPDPPPPESRPRRRKKRKTKQKSGEAERSQRSNSDLADSSSEDSSSSDDDLPSDEDERFLLTYVADDPKYKKIIEELQLERRRLLRGQLPLTEALHPLASITPSTAATTPVLTPSTNQALLNNRWKKKITASDAGARMKLCLRPFEKPNQSGT